MTIYQCPRCVLRFSSMAELGDHLHRDHPKFHVGGSWEQAPFRAGPYRHPFALRRLDPRRAQPEADGAEREQEPSGRS
jgi:hypothetical protein